jgi:hypothetical protein
VVEKINKELGYIYFTSDGKMFAYEDKAKLHQAQIDFATESKETIKGRKKMDAEKILEILKENGWGVFYKANPINLLGVQGAEAPIFSVNAVDDDILKKALKGEEGDTTWQSETDSLH